MFLIYYQRYLLEDALAINRSKQQFKCSTILKLNRRVTALKYPDTALVINPICDAMSSTTKHFFFTITFLFRDYRPKRKKTFQWKSNNTASPTYFFFFLGALSEVCGLCYGPMCFVFSAPFFFFLPCRDLLLCLPNLQHTVFY